MIEKLIILGNPSESRTRTILAFEAGDDMPVLLFCGSSMQSKEKPNFSR